MLVVGAQLGNDFLINFISCFFGLCANWHELTQKTYARTCSKTKAKRLEYYTLFQRICAMPHKLAAPQTNSTI